MSTNFGDGYKLLDYCMENKRNGGGIVLCVSLRNPDYSIRVRRCGLWRRVSPQSWWLRLKIDDLIPQPTVSCNISATASVASLTVKCT